LGCEENRLTLGAEESRPPSIIPPVCARAGAHILFALLLSSLRLREVCLALHAINSQAQQLQLEGVHNGGIGTTGFS